MTTLGDGAASGHEMTCDHCQLAIPPGALVADRIADEERRFCCQGCRGAYRIITGAGMGAFYRNRTWETAGLPEGAFAAEYDDAYLERFVNATDEGAELSLLIAGVRCASCIWVIERILADLPGVLRARLNYGSHRARVAFDPRQVSAGELFAAVTRIGYLPHPGTADAVQRSADRERRTLLVRFGTAFFLSMQLMGYSLALYAGYFQGMDAGARGLVQAFAAAVTTPVVWYAGWPFISGGWRSLRNCAPNMDLLIALGVLSAYGYSLWAMSCGGEVYFDTAAMIVTLILGGRLFENAARRTASSGVDRLLRLAPETARRHDGSVFRQVDAGLLQAGDLIQVLPGERFPTDGTVASGETEVDEATVTGEPLPMLRGAGSRIASGTLNLTTAVTVRVERCAADSFAARVARMVEEAQARRAPVQRLADRVSGRFVPLVVLTALLTGIGWTLFSGEVEKGMLNAVAVLIVACPCALGLATPTAVLVASGTAASRGILFRGGDILEAAARVSVAAFDKTGTLTDGRPSVAEVQPAVGDENNLLALAARVEAGSAHPLARGVLAAARLRGIFANGGTGSRVVPGRGAILETGDDTVRAGSRAFLEAAGIALPVHTAPSHLTEVHLAADREYRGVLLLEDRLRPSAAATVAALRRQGLGTVLLTGDRAAAGERVAFDLAIDQVFAGRDPQQKAAWVEDAQARGETVLMVGDGINDAPALSAAAVGCSLAGGTDIALETSDLVLARPDLELLPEALALASRTLRVIRQNLFWAFAYNLVALPLAAAGQLAPIHAAAAMTLSSVCVVGNSLRLAHKNATLPKTVVGDRRPANREETCSLRP